MIGKNNFIIKNKVGSKVMISKILIKIIFIYFILFFILKLAFGYNGAVENNYNQGLIKKDKIAVFYQRPPYDRAIYFNKIYKKGNDYFIFSFAHDEDYIGAMFVNKLNIVKNTISTIFKKENSIISNGEFVVGVLRDPVYSIIDENNFYITFLDNIADTLGGEQNYFIYQVKNNKLEKILYTPYELQLIPYKNYIYTLAKDKRETYLIKFSNDLELIEAKYYKKLIRPYSEYLICNDNLYIIDENKICKINLNNYKTMLIKEKEELKSLQVKDDKIYYLSFCQRKKGNEKDLPAPKKYTFSFNIIEDLQKKYTFKLPIKLTNPYLYFLSDNSFLIADSKKYKGNDESNFQVVITKLKLIANKKLLIDKTYKIKYELPYNYPGSLELSTIANELIITYGGWIPWQSGFIAFIPIDYLFSTNNLFIIKIPSNYHDYVKLMISSFSYPIRNPVLTLSSISNINYELFTPEDATIEPPTEISIFDKK
jgi:hypothetical protein